MTVSEPTGSSEVVEDYEHFPWHYTEFGVVCACGKPMRDEICPDARTVVLFVLLLASTRGFDLLVAAHRRGVQRVRRAGR
jgi:hypothetical protein